MQKIKEGIENEINRNLKLTQGARNNHDKKL
jgi:hypothetical protein